MITLRPSSERGHADHGWLDTHHTFSFADYWDPDWMGFRALRVINEDVVQPGQGFGRHPHRDMEIVTFILDGALEHKDSMGNGSIIRPGDVQRMSAGTGVFHSEWNPSETEPVHLLQIWIEPRKKGIAPSYEQKRFEVDEKRGKLRVIASPDGRDGSVTIHQDARILATVLEPGERVAHELARGRGAWIHVARGAVKLGERTLQAGDGAGVAGEAKLELEAAKASEVLVFDLP